MKIGLIGDSHTQVTFDLLIPVLESMGHEVVGRVSNPGWSTKSFNNKPSNFKPVVQNNPDVVIVSIGGNNYQLDDEKYRATVNQFLAKLGYPQRKIVWLGPLYAVRKDVDERHAWTNEWLKRNLPRGITYVDLYPFSASGHRDDGVHFSRSAYNQIVSSVQDKVGRAIGTYGITRYAKYTLPVVIPVALLVLYRLYISNRR